MIVDNFDLFLLDADGVIYIGNQPCPGAVDAIHELQKQGKGVRVLTNDSRLSRLEMQERLKMMDIHLNREDIITVSWATACYLVQQGIQNVQVVGTDALKREITEAGCRIVNHLSAEAVVVGFNENLTLFDIQEAIRSVSQGAYLIATNYDVSYPTPSGRQIASGSLVRMIEAVSGQKPIIVGKPSLFIFQMARNGFPENTRMVMIGDSPDIDILGAHQANIPGILVSSHPVHYPTPRDYRIPDAVIENLSSLFEQSFRLKFWQKPDFPWPSTIKVAVAALVIDPNRQVLLIKRKDNGYWALPTGKMEPGETLKEAVMREVYEETSLRIKVKHLVGIYSHPSHQVLSYNSGESIQFVTSCFLCELVDGHLVNDQSEILESGFFQVSSFPQPMVSAHQKWIQNALENHDRTVYD
jgi:HAD superfamily hydrolase (TIGR01450 family)